jgi:hypothetical protein
MTGTYILFGGGCAVFGAVVMALALILGVPLRDRRKDPVDTPTVEHDSLAGHFNEAMEGLLPLFIPDAPGIPLGDTEERVIKAIERDLAYGDSDFIALFKRDTET